MRKDPTLAVPRFAVYYAPSESSALWAFGNDWLGRDAATGEARTRPEVDGFDAARLNAITRTAAGYGFHATLKPPFALVDGRTADDLKATAQAFSATHNAFDAPPLEIASLDGFIALRPSAPSPGLDALAADCVRAFDVFRAPPSSEELAKQRENGLTAMQDRLLVEWGYPYVFEEWRFHVTLSCRLPDEERRALMSALEPRIAPLCSGPLVIDSICLFRQEDRTSPFRLMARFPLGGRATT